MNRYGRQAMRHWNAVRPREGRGDREPGDVLTALGEEVRQQIETLARTLEGPDSPGETYLEKVARLNTARFTAEGEREMVLIASPDQEGEDEEPWDEAMTDWFARRRRELQEEQDELDAETTRDHPLDP